MHFLAPSEGESKVPLSCHISEILSQIQLHLQDHLTWHNWGYPSNFGHWLVYDYTQSINGLTILTIISIHILPSYLTWSNHFITELTNHSIRDPAPFPGLCCCDLGPCKAWELQTSELLRHCRFPETLGKLSENSENGIGMNWCVHFQISTPKRCRTTGLSLGRRRPEQRAQVGHILPINGKGLGSVFAQ